MNNIVHTFFETAKSNPKKLAIIDIKEQITFSELASSVESTAIYLQQKGITKNDRILIFIPMSARLYIYVLALFSIGAVPVFLDEWVNAKRLALCCKLVNCKGFISYTKVRILGWFLKPIRELKLYIYPKSIKQNTFNNEIIDVEKSDTALITFTTGSTGIPKAADRTHGFLHAQLQAIIPLVENKNDSTNMPMLPIVLLVNLAIGKTSVIADFKSSKPKQFSPQKLVQQINKYNVTSIIGSPYYILQTAKYVLDSNTAVVGLQHVITGGGPVFPEDAETINKGFSNAIFTIVYGSTEAEPIAHYTLQKEKENKKINGLYVGKIDKKTDVKIIPYSDEIIEIQDEETLNKMELQDSQAGEIIVSGKHVLRRYINNEDAIKLNKIVVNNTVWHRTGDMGIKNGRDLFLLGRCKHTIVYKGSIYYPFLIEQELKKITGIEVGTMIERKGNAMFVLQVGGEFKDSYFEDYLDEKKLKGIDWRILEKIPMDKRHVTKIDYDKIL